jgi:hypothetical protein
MRSLDGPSQIYEGERDEGGFPIWQTDWNIHAATRDGRQYKDDGQAYYFDGERQCQYHDDRVL